MIGCTICIMDVYGYDWIMFSSDMLVQWGTVKFKEKTTGDTLSMGDIGSNSGKINRRDGSTMEPMEPPINVHIDNNQGRFRGCSMRGHWRGGRPPWGQWMDGHHHHCKWDKNKDMHLRTLWDLRFKSIYKISPIINISNCPRAGAAEKMAI